MPESGNLFLSIFFGIFFPEPSMNGIREKNFYRSFSTNLIPFSLKILPERGFLIYWFFFYFSRNFLTRVEYERNSGLNFFSTFLGLSHPVLAKNNSGKWYFIFFKFFAIFFGIFFPGPSMNEIRDKIFFHSFTTYLILFWLKIMPERCFLIFSLFFSIFFGIFLPGSNMNGIRE